MERVNKIIQHQLYQTCLHQIHCLEKNRIFCGHDMAHFLDVARLAYIFNLQENLHIEKEKIYAAALLHDIGRHVQYLDGTPHQIASIPIAKEILADCGFMEDEIGEMIEAIEKHRDSAVKKEKNLTGLIYRGDKASRACYGCMAKEACDWKQEQKNLILKE